MKTKVLTLSILLATTIFITGCTQTNNNEVNNLNNNSGEIIGIANPASVYCEENGGKLEMIFDNGESYGMCHFKNGAVCEEREFFRKECFPLSEDSETIHNLTGCTEEAKECPNGSWVSRNGPDCEFDLCPVQTNTVEEETITEILENHANTTGYQKEGLTEEDIDLMEAIIEKLK